MSFWARYRRRWGWSFLLVAVVVAGLTYAGSGIAGLDAVIGPAVIAVSALFGGLIGGSILNLLVAVFPSRPTRQP